MSFATTRLSTSCDDAEQTRSGDGRCSRRVHTSALPVFAVLRWSSPSRPRSPVAHSYERLRGAAVARVRRLGGGLPPGGRLRSRRSRSALPVRPAFESRPPPLLPSPRHPVSPAGCAFLEPTGRRWPTLVTEVPTFRESVPRAVSVRDRAVTGSQVSPGRLPSITGSPGSTRAAILMVIRDRAALLVLRRRPRVHFVIAPGMSASKRSSMQRSPSTQRMSRRGP